MMFWLSVLAVLGLISAVVFLLIKDFKEWGKLNDKFPRDR